MKLIEICVGIVLAVACKLLTINGETTFAVTTVYEDSACNEVPTLLTFSPDAALEFRPMTDAKLLGTRSSLCRAALRTMKALWRQRLVRLYPSLLCCDGMQQRWVRVRVLCGRLLS